MKVGERHLPVVEVARRASEFREPRVPEVFVVGVEKMDPHEERILARLQLLDQRDRLLRETSRRVEPIDMRARRRVALAGRAEESIESVDPTELGREEKVRCGTGRPKPGLLHALGKENVLAEVAHFVLVGPGHL